MEIELDNLLMEQQSAWMDRPAAEPRPGTSGPSSSGQGTSGLKREPAEKYDDAYFDSSDEEDNFRSSRKVKTNDELLYDPDADDQDEAWMAKQGGLKKADNSDAILNCPSCMTVLCVDCQRHEKYHTQVTGHAGKDYILRQKVCREDMLQAYSMTLVLYRGHHIRL